MTFKESAAVLGRVGDVVGTGPKSLAGQMCCVGDAGAQRAGQRAWVGEWTRCKCVGRALWVHKVTVCSPSTAQMSNISSDCFFPQTKPPMLFLNGTLVFLSHQKSSQMSSSDLQQQHGKAVQACSFVCTLRQWRNC